MRISLITESVDGNSLGRTYCLWLIAQHLGWDADVLSTHGDEVWKPLRGTEFASVVRKVSSAQLDSAVQGADLIIACKPLPLSLGLALPLSRRCRIPLLIDIDDPDLQVRRRRGRPLAAALRWMRRPLRSIADMKSEMACRKYPTIVSNPWLESRYGGAIVPHVRPLAEAGAKHEGDQLRLVFVGTNHPHKGVDVLRGAVAKLQTQGRVVSLTVTDHAPEDAQPWEHWIGTTTMEAGLQLTAEADAVVLPSLRTRHSEGQLPVKLIDAMMFGRAIIVSDVEPLPWAVGDGGIVVPAGESDGLADALSRIRDEDFRRTLGERARLRAVEAFSTAAVAPVFAHACKAAIDAYGATSKRLSLAVE